MFFVRFNKLSQTGVGMLTFARYFSREVVVDSASLFFQRSFARLSFSRFFFAGHHVGPTVTVTQNTSSATNTTPTAAAEAAAADATAALDGDYNLPGATGTGDVLQQDALSMSWAGVLQPGTHTAEVLGFPSSGSSASPGGSAFGCSATGATGTAVSVIVLPGAVAMRSVRAPTPAPPARSYQYFHRFFSREVVSNQGRTITFSRYFVRASTTFNVFAISEGAVPIGGGPPVVQPQVVFLSFARSFNRAVNFARASYFSRLTAYFSRCFHFHSL